MCNSRTCFVPDVQPKPHLLCCSSVPSLLIHELWKSEHIGCILATQGALDYFWSSRDLLVSLVVCLLVNQRLRFRKTFSSHHMVFQFSLLFTLLRVPGTPCVFYLVQYELCYINFSRGVFLSSVRYDHVLFSRCLSFDTSPDCWHYHLPFKDSISILSLCGPQESRLIRT